LSILFASFSSSSSSSRKGRATSEEGRGVRIGDDAIMVALSTRVSREPKK
jgi:hypothetical protein